jgi:hypothetical protein
MDFEKKQSYYLSKYAAGTGEWFLTSDTFKTWLDGAPQILWCRGQRMETNPLLIIAEEES